MIYYINVTSWNLLESFVTESISPHFFYLERSFGNNLSRFLDSNHELSNFLVLSTRETKSDYSIQVDSSLIDEESLSPVKSHSTLFTYSKTIYYKKGLVAFRFATEELMSSLIAEAHILLDVKCVDKYADCFYVSSKGFKSVEVASKLANHDGFSFELNESVMKDNLFNTLKGAILSYARGVLTTSNSDEQKLKSQLLSLKNMFAGLNTTIMISGDKVKDVESISVQIQEAKAIYNRMRGVKTNQFDIISQQFAEIVRLAEERAKTLAQFKGSNLSVRENQLKEEKKKIEEEVFKMEVDCNIAGLRSELQVIKDQERLNGKRLGKDRVYFKKGSAEYERKSWLKKEISQFEETHSEYKSLIFRIKEIDMRIAELNSGNTQYDNVIIGIFTRISDIMNDLIKKVNDTEVLNNVDLSNIVITADGNISVKVNGACAAEVDYLNIALQYLIANPPKDQISDALILNLIVETAKIFKDYPSATTEEGMAIMKCLREFWCYKNQRCSVFSIPENLPVFQSIIAFYVKPFGFEQMERYILHKKYTQKAFGFMLWGACLGFASLPKTFTNVIYQDDDISIQIDEYLQRTNSIIRQ